MCNYNSSFDNKKVLIVHHWPILSQREKLFSSNFIYLTCSTETGRNVINVSRESRVDMEMVLLKLKEIGWEPDLFIAKVDAFLGIVPVNVGALKCPKVLVLGDTQHGDNPLGKLISYAHSEPYDHYLTDHKRHHLWFYHLSGIRNTHWLPGLFLNPVDFSDRSNLLRQTIFVGQNSIYHPRRNTILPYLEGKDGLSFKTVTAPQVESLRLYNQSSSSLNISLNGDLNLRFLEIPSAKGVQVSDRLSEESGASLLFEEGREIVYFDNKEELAEKCKKINKDIARNSLIRKNAHLRYVDEYCPEKNAKYLFDIIYNNDVPDKFRSTSIPRIKHIKSGFITLERVTLYQEIQNYHKNQETVSVLFLIDDMEIYPEDILDLPRVTVDCLHDNVKVKNRLADYMNFGLDCKRLHFLALKNITDRYDVVVYQGKFTEILDRILQKTNMKILCDEHGKLNIN